MKALAIVGGAGRMGQALGEGLSALDEFSVAALVDEHEPRELFGGRYVPSLSDLDPSTIDVVINFSSPEGAVDSATWCAQNGVALVVGTTGLSSEQRHVLEETAERVGVTVSAAER